MDIAATFDQNGYEHAQPNFATVPVTPDNGIPGKKKLGLRFLLAIKIVLFSSVVNIMLVFVPVGIAARKLANAVL